MRKEQNLSVQVLAGALAAIVAALAGSTLGVAGTVVGAGIASILTTLGVVLYQRMHARAPRSAPLIAGGLLAFVLGLVLITGLEWATGSQLSGGKGTTIGGIVGPRHDPGPATRPAQVDPAPAPSATTTPSPPQSTTPTPPSTPPSSGETTAPPTTTTPPATTSTTTSPPSSGTG